jgi:pimeloyl-ACP methyl ester carboxylesterase
VIGSRVPDVRFLIDHLLRVGLPGLGIFVDPARIGIVGHSFGGWTALAMPKVEPAIRAVVVLAPGGASQPPGILPVDFRWGRDAECPGGTCRVSGLVQIPLSPVWLRGQPVSR